MSNGRVSEASSGYVLHARPYLETSLLVEAYCEDFGRIGLVARGARAARSALRGLLRPFQPLVLAWRSRGDLATLTRAEADGCAHLLVGPAVATGLYLNELIMRTVARHDPQPELYHAYARALLGLSQSAHFEPTLRVFEKRLLEVLGYGLLLDVDANDGTDVDPAAIYCYERERGPVRVQGDRVAGCLVSGATLLAIRDERLTDERVLKEARSILRAALQPHLGARPVLSREIFRGLASAGDDA